MMFHPMCPLSGGVVFEADVDVSVYKAKGRGMF